jgi:hypothetical protein
MRKLSYWGKMNPRKTHIIIVISHILLLLLGWYTGTLLSEAGISLPGILLLFFILYYLAAVFFYPAKNEKTSIGSYRFYIKQKACDLSLAAAAWGMIICIANNKSAPYEYFQNSLASTIETVIVKEKPTASEILESLKYRDKSTLTKEEKRILKKEFRVQLKKYAVAKVTGDKKAGDNAGLIILAIVGALGLLILVGALACNISCNGGTGGAIAVALLGTAAVVIGLIAVIRSIKRKSQTGKGTTTDKST